MANRAISDKNYEHVLNVWKTFRLKIMKDYLYLKVDGLLLVYVFETFRKELIRSFELESACYLITQGYSWDEWC